jgi:ADP-ribose pyrophosphatase YjhB (NUDIX family)/uncharacterized protein (DUF952 family)
VSATVLDWRHCPRCATPLDAHAGAHDAHVRCPACGFFQYDNPVPAAVVLIVRGDELLVVRRAIEPYRGRWDTVGGFLDPGETAEACAVREVREELGCELVGLEPLGTFASTYGDGGRATVGMAFTAGLAPGAQVRLDEENSEFAWAPLDAVPDLAFDDGRAAVDALLDRRRLFHVARRVDFDRDADAYVPPAFAAEGFVHLARRAQVDGVLERWFAGQDDLVLLTLDVARLDDVRWEPGAKGDPGPFPHLYGPVPRAAVLQVTPIA